MNREMGARTYNQIHHPRKYTKGHRRLSVYIPWSYPQETNRNPAQLDNRFSTTTEIRRVQWPAYEEPQWSDAFFPQGSAGSLELFFRTWVKFQQVVEEVTGHVLPMYQRVDQAGFALPLDRRVLDDTDTLLVFSLDHLISGQEPSPEEIEAVRTFLRREGTCLVISPHHDIGHSDDPNEREMEYLHHRDPLVPRQQRFAGYARSLMKGLGIPIVNRWGLHSARNERTSEIAPLTVMRDLDTRGWLTGVHNLNLHPHLPHYAVTADNPRGIHVLATQPIDMSRPHPFMNAGNREFNAFVWIPPAGDRAGDVLLVDSTQFSTLFGENESLERFWKNLAEAK